MITLDPELIGQLAEPGHVPFTTAELPFSKKPRLDRLRELGKADELLASEEEGEEVGGNNEERRARKEEKVKMKMRGKGKSMKRYLKKKRKNVIDPSSVSLLAIDRMVVPLQVFPLTLELISPTGCHTRKNG